MKGIVLVSHGKTAEGIADSASMFFGDMIKQFDYLGMEADEQPDAFLNRMKKKAASVDDGDGVLIFVDLLGGTPSNQSIMMMNEQIKVITGMNLTMVIETLCARIGGDINIDSLIKLGRDGIVCLNDQALDYELEE